jgi:type IV pilus assembly protein PilW
VRTLTLAAPATFISAYAQASTEVFTVQTMVYYVKRSSGGTGTSLYRLVFDGTAAGGTEQELVENVENMQLTYAVSTIDATTSLPTGLIDKTKTPNYRTADAIEDWNQVLAVRMSLLLRAPTPTQGDTVMPPSGLVGGVTVTYPTSDRHERKVFTTTVAARNKIAYQ